MNIYKLTGRNLEITEAMRSYAEDKLEKLNRFSDQIVDARVVMSYDHGGTSNPARVEVQLNVPNGIVRAEEDGPDSYAAIDKVVDKLERQLKRFKGKMLARRTEDVLPPPAAEPEDEEPRLARTKRHVLRPMTPEDAAMQMEALGHDFFMFHNLETNLTSVIYLRNDGDYGLIEPAN
ncbi:ribosome-associated translation inhibitor RaiA [soil metagenome]